MTMVRILAGRYRLEKRLGGGGMSVVWRAYDEVLGRRVAIKVVSSRHTAEVLPRSRIRTEAEVAARLSHPCITKVHDYGESGDTPFVVMELLEGQTLAQRLRAGPLPPRAAAEVGAQVAGALAAAHARGLVHCDIKPSNIMLTSTGATVLDFGIAAATGELDARDALWGTPAYIAPERLTGRHVLPASDVYALGLLLYRALAGRMPWRVRSTTQMLAAHVSVEPEPLPEDAGVPPEIATLCARCLAKDPSQRPTAQEVAAELAAVLTAGRHAPRHRRMPAITVHDGSSRPRWRHAAMRTKRLGRITPLGPAGFFRVMVTVLATVLIGLIVAADASRPPSGYSAAAPVGVAPSPPAGAAPAPDGGWAPVETPSAPQPEASGAASRTAGAIPVASTPHGGAADLGSSGLPAGSSHTSRGSGGRGGSGIPAATAGPSSPSVSPGPSVPPESTAIAPIDQLVSTVGGTVVARCVGSTASLVSWTLLPGFGLDTVEPGPAAEVSIVFHSTLLEVRVKAWCVSGVPRASVDTVAV